MKSAMSLTIRTLSRLFFMLIPALLLGACQGTGNGSARPHLGAGTIVVIEGIDGVSKPLQQAVQEGLEKGAQRYGVKLTNAPDQAGLHLRGYLTAGPHLPQGQAATLVWDVFDAQETRIQRITSTLPAPSNQSGLSGREASQLAETSMNDLADFLKE
jgi:hypothetical protein